MTIPEACQLVLQAGAHGARAARSSCSTWASRSKIVDLARDLIRSRGLRAGDDIEIVFTGVRPGEKLFEELSVAEEQAEKTRHPKIFVGRFRAYEWDAVIAAQESCVTAALMGDAEAVRSALLDAVPEFLGGRQSRTRREVAT